MSHRRQNPDILTVTFFVLITIQKSDRGCLSPFSRKKRKTDSRFKKVILQKSIQLYNADKLANVWDSSASGGTLNPGPANSIRSIRLWNDSLPIGTANPSALTLSLYTMRDQRLYFFSF